MINKAIICGNLTRDAEERKTKANHSILVFTVAVNDRVKDASGEWVDYANFIDCTMFGKYAEVMKEHLKKGVKVCVEGKLRYSAWEAEDGTKRSKVGVNVDNAEVMR